MRKPVPRINILSTETSPVHRPPDSARIASGTSDILVKGGRDIQPIPFDSIQFDLQNCADSDSRRVTRALHAFAH